jgi:hypothetical protein
VRRLFAEVARNTPGLPQLPVAGEGPVGVPFIPKVDTSFLRLGGEMDDLGDTSRDLVQQMRDEVVAREKLNTELDKALDRIIKQEDAILSAISGRVPGASSGGDTSSGSGGTGGGRGVVAETVQVGPFNTTIQEAHSPQFVAEQIKNRQIAAARSMGERAGRAVRGR